MLILLIHSFQLVHQSLHLFNCWFVNMAYQQFDAQFARKWCETHQITSIFSADKCAAFTCKMLILTEDVFGLEQSSVLPSVVLCQSKFLCSYTRSDAVYQHRHFCSCWVAVSNCLFLDQWFSINLCSFVLLKVQYFKAALTQLICRWCPCLCCV